MACVSLGYGSLRVLGVKFWLSYNVSFILAKTNLKSWECQAIGFMHGFTTSWISASSLFPVCHYWTHWLIQVCLTSVVMATIIRHTWINQFCPIVADRKQRAGWSSGSSTAVHKAHCLYKRILLLNKCAIFKWLKSRFLIQAFRYDSR